MGAVRNFVVRLYMGKKNKFLNLKIGVEFHDALMTQPCFQDNWKAVSPSFFLIKLIASLNEMKDGSAVEFFSGTIGDLFQPYTGGAYLPYLNALETLNILEIYHVAVPSKNKTGKCNQYRVTDYGCRLIYSADMAYLKRLVGDKALKRRIQKSISNRKVMKKSYDDPVLDYIYDGLKNISCDVDYAEGMFAKAQWSDPQKASVSILFCQFAEKSFDDLKIGEKDGRIHHELVRLKSDARVAMRHKNIPYKAVLDIRSCHLTFFSAYISSLPSTLHYVTDDEDRSAILRREHEKWIDLFCDPKKDPKKMIQKACGFEDVEMAKVAMNQSLNGSKAFPKFLKWMKQEYPTLFFLWQKTKVKDTGNAIGRQFEQRLMLNPELFTHATELGIPKVMPEHDGLGVFAHDSDSELQFKLTELAQYLRNTSKKMFGVPVVVKIKTVYDWQSADTLLDMQHKRDMLEKEYSELEPKENRLRKKYFATGKKSQHWQEFEDVHNRVGKLLIRNRDVIDYWWNYEIRRNN
jgi:hypothetical protein